ncbi:uncharacterized protein [Nicotiana tomentosiformis]|uniref:uncharacterized protein n=1 Tax=Nicotiana tomentosiformis TaxID=4098 RepID=UPI00388CD771
MSLKTAKEVWDYLKEEYAGDERIKGMQVLNLIREFELQKMKESEIVKEYSDRLLNIANKILVTVPERYEATITTLENTKDLSQISLAELLNSLKAQEQRRLMRQDVTTEGALAAKHQVDGKNKIKKKKKKKKQSSFERRRNINQQ